MRGTERDEKMKRERGDRQCWGEKKREKKKEQDTKKIQICVDHKQF